MIRTFPFLAVLVLLSGLAGLCARQDADALSVRFRILPWEVHTGEIYYQSGGGYERLRARPNSISHEYTYAGDNPMLLYRKAVSGDGTAFYQPYATVPFHPASRSNLLILYRNPGDPQSPLGTLYPFEFSAQDEAPLVLFNMAPFAVKIQLDSKIIDLNPGEITAFNNRRNENADASVRCKIAAHLDGKWKLIYNRAITPPPTGSLYFFFRGTNPEDEYANNMPIRVLRLTDFPISEEQRLTMSLNDQPVEVQIGGY